MPNIFEKIFGKSAEAVTKTIAETIDGLSTSDKEKLEAKEKLTEVVMTNLNHAIELQQNIIVSEAQGNWLQRSWRPILMLSFGFIIIYRYFIGPVFHFESIDLPDQFWNLLDVGIGGYVIGRSVEKVADTVVKNVDMPFLKKKDRK